MKKGFTLIELLAVIVILGLILLIIVPIVSDVINRARGDAFESSVNSLIRTVESDYAQDTSETLPSQKTYVFVNGVQTEGPELKIGGKKPQNGHITIQRNGKIEVVLDDGKTCITKPFDAENVTTRTLGDAEVCEILSLPDNENITYIYDLPNIGENATPCLIEGNEFTHILDKRDDKTYAVTQIGDQCWFAEDLMYDCGNTTWNGNSCRLNGNAAGTVADATSPSMHYQWEAVMNGSTTEGAQGLCPTGWTVPTDDEWKTLEMFLGMTQEQADLVNAWRGTNQGQQLKSTNPSWNGTNTVGFNAVPAGARLTSGTLFSVGSAGDWWSSSPSGSNAWRRYLYSGSSAVHRLTHSQANGFLVRCLLGQ